MPDSPERSIILRPDVQIEKSAGEKRRIVAAMIDESLSLARLAQTLEAKRFRIGQYEWCESDYRQILMWADALELEPEEVVHRLLSKEMGKSVV